MITIPQFLDFATDTDNTEIVQGFLKLLELKSHGLFLHSQQVANYAAATAIKMGLPLSEVNGIKTAALLHDIGQLAIPQHHSGQISLFQHPGTGCLPAPL